MVPQPDEVTALLEECRVGNRDAIERLLPLVYDELRAVAARALRRERDDHTLQPTALVHEAYLRLVGQQEMRWENRAHFFGCAARVIRNILVDSARAHLAEKRGGDLERVTLDEGLVVSDESAVDILAMDEALRRLGEISARQSEGVALRFFAGMSLQETAAVLGVSVATVKNDWVIARAWLRRELAAGTSL